MDVVLISHRGGRVPHWSSGVAEAAAATLARAGCRVRWLQATTGGGEPPPCPEGVECHPVSGAIGAFRRVTARLRDAAMDDLLTRQLRRQPADVVHDVGFGAPGSANTLWIADRMGARAAATVRAAEVVCHRQTLVDATGAGCRDFLDAARCTACCLAPGAGGQSRARSALARAAGVLGAFSPFPNANAFAIRSESLLGGLTSAGLLLAAEAGEGEALATAGIRLRTFRSGPLAELHGASLLPLYRSMLTA